MTPAAFRTCLKALNLTIGAFAALVGVNPTTAGYWGRTRPGGSDQVFPLWVPLLLDAWERQAPSAKATKSSAKPKVRRQQNDGNP